MSPEGEHRQARHLVPAVSLRPEARDRPRADAVVTLTPEQLYDQFAELVNRLVRRLLGPDPDQDDLVHEAFLRMLRSIDQVRDPDRLYGWVAKVTVSTVHDWLRKRRTRRRYHAAQADPETVAGSVANPEQRYLAMRVVAALEKLPADQRLAFSIRHFERLPLHQVADMCDCSLATVKRRLARAEKRFKVLAARDPALAALLEQSKGDGDQER